MGEETKGNESRLNTSGLQTGCNGRNVKPKLSVKIKPRHRSRHRFVTDQEDQTKCLPATNLLCSSLKVYNKLNRTDFFAQDEHHRLENPLCILNVSREVLPLAAKKNLSGFLKIKEFDHVQYGHWMMMALYCNIALETIKNQKESQLRSREDRQNT